MNVPKEEAITLDEKLTGTFHFKRSQNISELRNDGEEEDYGDLPKSSIFMFVLFIGNILLEINHRIRILTAYLWIRIDMALCRVIRRFLIRQKLWMTNKSIIYILGFSFVYWTLCLIYLEYPDGHVYHPLRRMNSGRIGRIHRRGSNSNNTHTKDAMEAEQKNIQANNHRRSAFNDARHVSSSKSTTNNGDRSYIVERTKTGRKLYRSIGVIDKGQKNGTRPNAGTFRYRYVSKKTSLDMTRKQSDISHQMSTQSFLTSRVRLEDSLRKPKQPQSNTTMSESFQTLKLKVESAQTKQAKTVMARRHTEADGVVPERVTKQNLTGSKPDTLYIGSRGIPHIIHQIWDTDSVPGVFYTWIYSWLAINPSWQHWFWTMEDARNFLQRHYPQYLEVYDRYPQQVMKADWLRYFIMAHHGGVYVDIDMEALQPLEHWTDNVTCFLSEEPHVHPYFYYEVDTPMIGTSILGCRPGHPFFRQVLQNLPAAAKAYPEDAMNSTGPNFLDGQYTKYMRKKIAGKISSGYLKQSKQDGGKTWGRNEWVETELEKKVRGKVSDVDNDIVVAHPDLFLPTYDPQAQELVMTQCTINYENLSPKLKALCAGPIEQQFANKPWASSYTNHHWVHVSLWSEERKSNDPVNVFEIVPKAKKAADMVNIYR